MYNRFSIDKYKFEILQKQQKQTTLIDLYIYDSLKQHCIHLDYYCNFKRKAAWNTLMW